MSKSVRGNPMISGFPPPVTVRSSKTALWEELCAANQEIDAQQSQINNAHGALHDKDRELANLRQQMRQLQLRLNVIKAALAE